MNKRFVLREGKHECHYCCQFSHQMTFNWIINVCNILIKDFCIAGWFTAKICSLAM